MGDFKMSGRSVSSKSRSSQSGGGRNALKFPGMSIMMDKLDEDFLYSLGGIQLSYKELVEPHDKELAEAWLRKLVSSQPIGIEAKRIRNLYMLHLLLAMHSKLLPLAFQKAPPEGDLPDPDGLFGPEMPNFRIQEPGWLTALINQKDRGITHHSKDGRTYLATKELENGNGAFGYIAVTIGDKDDKKADDGEEDEDDDDEEEKMDESVENHEENIKRLLKQRPTEAERNRLKRFYLDISESITQELDGEGIAVDHVNMLMQKLEQNLRYDGQMEELWGMEEEDRRKHLLMIIRDKVEKRMQTVKEREENLNEVEKALMPKVPSPFEHRTEGGMWRQTCATNFTDHVLAELKSSYPRCVVVRFIQLLIAERMKAVHTFKKQLTEFEKEVEEDYKKELEGFVTTYKQSRNEYLETSPVVKAIRQFRKDEAERKRLAEEERRRKLEEGSKTSDESSAQHVTELMKEMESTKNGIHIHEHEVKHLQAEIESQNNLLKELHRRNKKLGEQHAKEMHRLQAQIKRLQQEVASQDQNVATIKKMIEDKK